MNTLRKEEIIILIIAAIILFLLLACFIILFIIMYQRRRNQHTHEMAQLKQTYDKEILKSQLEIQEQTFHTISQEIHDNIGQVLSLAKLNLNIMAPECNHLPMMAITSQLVGKAINDLRNLSKSLSPERVADLDLSESLGYELEMLEKTGLYTTTMQVQGSVYHLPKDKKIVLFRIFQEVISNIVKHAAADTISVIMNYSPALFVLSVKDNGKGFDMANHQTKSGDGIGLKNMESRSFIIGAAFEMKSAEGFGTSVQISLPNNM